MPSKIMLYDHVQHFFDHNPYFYVSTFHKLFEFFQKSPVISFQSLALCNRLVPVVISPCMTLNFVLVAGAHLCLVAQLHGEKPQSPLGPNQNENGRMNLLFWHQTFGNGTLWNNGCDTWSTGCQSGQSLQHAAFLSLVFGNISTGGIRVTKQGWPVLMTDSEGQDTCCCVCGHVCNTNTWARLQHCVDWNFSNA